MNKKIAQANTSSWITEATQRQENKDWLEASFLIALKILRYLRSNQITQKDLAKRLQFSPQYLNKLLRGKENLTLETIYKIQNEIVIPLIQIPSFEYEQSYRPSTEVLATNVVTYQKMQREEVYTKSKSEEPSNQISKYATAA
ncbi:MAG: helix-turn-helix transcriptional regulator [Cyanobacteria bacterium J06649_11]